MKKNKRKDKSLSIYSLTRITKRRKSIENDSFDINEDANNNDYKENSTIRKTKPFQLLGEEFKETFKQNDLNWSINQMNQYLQSSNHFKMIYNIKIRAYNSINGLLGLFKREVMNKSRLKNNFLYGNSSFKANRFFTYIVIGSLGFCILSSVFKRKLIMKRNRLFFNRKTNEDKNIIQLLQNKNQELTNQNNDLKKILTDKYNV